MTVFRTGLAAITLSDDPDAGGLTIEVARSVAGSAMRLAMTAAGIELSIGSSTIRLTAGSVSVNDGALEVT